MNSPLLSAFAADATFLLRTREPAPRAWAADRCAGAIEALAAAFPRKRHAIQCCDDPVAFVLGTLAAWCAGQTVVMPGTRLADDLAALVARYPDSHVLDAASFARAVHDAVGARGASRSEAPMIEAPVTAASITAASMTSSRMTEAPVSAASMAEPSVIDSSASVATLAQQAAHWLLDAATPRWPSFAPDPQLEAVVLFTSGSTRAPRANVKSWDALLRGAETFRLAFPTQSRPPLLAGSVDCHHMFGLEANLMAAIHCGYPLCIDRPQLPADLADLLRGVAQTVDSPPLWLVTTPLQLSTFHRALKDVAGVERVIVATMPLDRMLAIEVERDWNTRVDEIYGNTECGVMATRRAARDPAFRPAPGVRFEFAADGSASAARAPDVPVALDDRVAPCEGGGGGAFLLLGRRGDLVKVAGKRSTLRALDAQLLDIPGVVDGAFLVPGDDNDHAEGRVAAVVVAPGLALSQLRRELAQRVDPAFMPRPLWLADALPRDDRGKLPRERLLQLVATLARDPVPSAAPTLPQLPTSTLPREAGALSPRLGPHAKSIQRERTFDASHPVFAGHFPGHPIVPGAILIAEIEDLLEAHGYRALACESAKFLAPVSPRECCTMRVDCSDPHRARFEIAVAQRVSVRGVMRCEAVAR